jgi:hypothetical protein
VEEPVHREKRPSLKLGGATGPRALKELARSYLAISKDLGRVMSRLNAIYRSWSLFELVPSGKWRIADGDKIRYQTNPLFIRSGLALYVEPG